MRNMKFWRTALVATLVLTVMLSVTGGTIAWVTDSVESKGNKIEAGNLDVALLMHNGSAYEDISENTAPIFGAGSIAQNDNAATLWEPGKTQIVYLGVQNKGNLDIKYNIELNVIDGGLIGALEYAVVAGAQPGTINADDWAALKANAQTGEVVAGITKAAPYGAIKAGTDAVDYFALAVHMKEEAGNEYQNKDVTIDIAVLATQLASEEDSFDNQYDAEAPAWTGASDTNWYNDASVTEYTLTTAEELAGLAELVNGGNDFAGKTVKLDANIDLGGKEWTAIGSGETFNREGDGTHTIKQYFKGTFDGQGHTISNLKIDDENQSYAALFAAAQNATIKNVNVKNVDINGDTTAAAILGYAKSATIENCHVSGEVAIVTDWAYAGGIVAYGYADIKNCSVIADGTGEIKSMNRNAVGGIAGWWNESAGSIAKCEVKNIEITGWANVGGLAGYCAYGNTIDNCIAENIVLTKTREDGKPSIGLATGGWLHSNNKTTKITNNTFSNITLNGQSSDYEVANILYGSEYYGGIDISGFVLENNVQTNITNNLTVVTP